jgi:hypothetical protein
MATKSLVRLDLNLLGKTPVTVARNLKKRGITGVKHQSRACPLANFFREELTPFCGDAATVSVDGDKLKVYNSSRNIIIDVKLPKALKQFVKGFDSGKYDYLEN